MGRPHSHTLMPFWVAPFADRAHFNLNRGVAAYLVVLSDLKTASLRHAVTSLKHFLLRAHYRLRYQLIIAVGFARSILYRRLAQQPDESDCQSLDLRVSAECVVKASLPTVANRHPHSSVIDSVGSYARRSFSRLSLNVDSEFVAKALRIHSFAKLCLWYEL